MKSSIILLSFLLAIPFSVYSQDEQLEEKIEIGGLSIQSNPEAEIYINGENTGQLSPLINYELFPGWYCIELINEEFNMDNFYSIEIESERITTITNRPPYDLEELNETDNENSCSEYYQNNTVRNNEINVNCLVSGPESYRGAERTNRRFGDHTRDCIIYEDDSCEYILCKYDENLLRDISASCYQIWEQESYECN